MSDKLKIIKKKELPEDAVIKGFTFLKEPDEDNEKKQDFISVVSEEKLACFFNDTKKYGFSKGYVKIDDTEVEYLEVKYIPLIILLLILLSVLLCCFGGIFLSGDKNKEPDEDDKQIINVIGDEWDGELPDNNDITPATQSIEIPGYAFVYVSEEEPEVVLINPDGNSVYFEYVISYNGEELIRTDYLKPNSQTTVNLYEKINTPGEYKVEFAINTVDVETHDPCNGAVQTVDLKVY